MESLTYEHHRIQQIEADSEYMRRNICKPWKWHAVRRMFPKFSSRVDNGLKQMRMSVVLATTLKMFNQVKAMSSTNLENVADNIRRTRGMEGSFISNAESSASGHRETHTGFKLNVEQPSVMRQISNQSKLQLHPELHAMSITLFYVTDIACNRGY